MPVEMVRKELDRIRGHLVWMPLDFLCEEQMAERGLQVNQYTEVSSYYRFPAGEQRRSADSPRAECVYLIRNRWTA